MTDTHRILRSIDLTNLADDCSADDVRDLCRRAVTPHGSVAAVCVWPRFVGVARDELDRGPSVDDGSPNERGVAGRVAVATVTNFPSGDESVDAVVLATRDALSAGADEIDVVLPYRAFSHGDVASAARLLDAVRATVDGGRLLKVILETGELMESDLIRRAARLAVDHGADFVKTSTGKTSVSATVDAVRIVLEVVLDEFRATGRVVGIKPSGGIRRIDDALRYLRLCDEMMGADWATPRTFRLGASALLDEVLGAIDEPV